MNGFRAELLMFCFFIVMFGFEIPLIKYKFLMWDKVPYPKAQKAFCVWVPNGTKYLLYVIMAGVSHKSLHQYFCHILLPSSVMEASG